MGVGNFLVMVAAFTAGISAIVLVIASAVKRVGAGGAASVERALQDLHDEVELLRGEVERLRGEVEGAGGPSQLEDIQNRLDFAERMLAQVKARDALPGPR